MSDTITIRFKMIVFCDGEKLYEGENIQEMFDTLNIPNTEEYHGARICILQNLLCFGEMDLSAAYQGHRVRVEQYAID